MRMSVLRAVLARVERKYGKGAQIMHGHIVWEEGPYQWTYACIDLTDDMDVWTEPVNHYELAVYQR